MTSGYIYFSTGQMYYEPKEMFIEIDPEIPSPQNRIQTHVHSVLAEQLTGLKDHELEYIQQRVSNCVYFPHGTCGTLNYPLWDRMKRTQKHIEYMNSVRVDYAMFHGYNQYYILHKQKNIIRVDLLKRSNKYTRMKKLRGKRLELTKITAEINTLQRKKRRLKLELSAPVKRNGAKNNKASVS